MSLKTKLKANIALRGLRNLYYEYFGIRRRSFGLCGKNVTITPPLNIDNPKNVYLHGNNQLEHCTIHATIAKFIMKYGAGAAVGFRVHTGNHLRIPGRFWRTITDAEKLAMNVELDRDVIVEEDVWIGSNVTLLAGVTIGRGSTIAAGAVVNKSQPPYCICAGVPAKPVKFYWTVDEILIHEAALYPESERYSREYLEKVKQDVEQRK